MGFKEKIIRFLAEQPKPDVVIQFSPLYVAVLRTETAGGSSFPGREYFRSFQLPAGILEANYLRPNIRNHDYLLKVLDGLLGEIGFSGHSASLILPEMSGRVFIFTLEGGLASPEELNHFVGWRLSRLLAQEVSRLRYSYQVFNSGQEKKILVVCSAMEVVKEYESLFKAKKIHVGKVSLPSLSVLNLVLGTPDREDDFLMVDLDYDYLSLVACAAEGFLVYRQKSVWSGMGVEKITEEAVNEIENTFNYVEEKLKRRLEAIYLRSNLGGDGTLAEKLQKLSQIKVIKIMAGYEELVSLAGGF